jgi:hypothetical protein
MLGANSDEDEDEMSDESDEDDDDDGWITPNSNSYIFSLVFCLICF